MKVTDDQSYGIFHRLRRAQWAAEEAGARAQLADHARQAEAQRLAEQAEQAEQADRRKKLMAERRAEVAPWRDLLEQLKQRAKDEGPARDALGRQDLDAAIDGLLRQEAAAKLVPILREQLRRRFPFATHLERFE